MRIALPCLCLLAACNNGPSQQTNPLMLPITVQTNDARNQRQGAVEVFVKTNHPALIAQIGAGSGPLLTQAMDVAKIPLEDRPARLIQLQSSLELYAATPSALATALVVYGV